MNTLLDLLPRIEALKDREALRFSNGLRTEVWSYSKLLERIRACVFWFENRGIEKGQRVVIWAENRPEWVVVFWAALARGAVLVPVDDHASAERVGSICDLAGARFLIYGDSTFRLEASDAEQISLSAIGKLPDGPGYEPVEVGPDDIVEVLYTSGTTAASKGVVHRHRNICSNLTPIAREIDKYQHWARPFQPIRFLSVVPLSHMFGQSVGLFVAPLFGGAVAFTTELHPARLIQAIRSERISVLVCVPRILGSISQEIGRRHPPVRNRTAKTRWIPVRWWRYRKVHRELGWKFWAFVVGGARLDPDLEELWSRIGLLVVQGYGLTETSPVVAVNHPLHARQGTLGQSIGGHEIRLAEDGEILVRGPSVVEEYLDENNRTAPTLDDAGWFHTGDLGTFDPDGRLRYRGRKKDLIVTSDGLNVHPEDVESVLNRIPGVRDSAVVAKENQGVEQVHAALILDPEVMAARIIEEANRRLEPHQRIRSWSIWPDEVFPRTPSSFKLQRHRVAEALGQKKPSEATTNRVPSSFLEIVSQSTGFTLDRLGEDRSVARELGLSSLERVELLASLEEHYGIELDESEFAQLDTIGEMDRHIQQRRMQPTSDSAQARPDASLRVRPVRIARWRLVRATGRFVSTILVRPLLACFVTLRLRGAEHLQSLSGPAIFAATHTSHLDVPVIYHALPPEWRRRLAPAVRQEYFFPRDPSKPGSGWLLRCGYYLTAVVFNVYPLPQRLGQVRESLRYTGELVSAGYCPLVFPEGRRTEDGDIQEFRPGVGFMAKRLQVPVIPVRLEGVFEILPTGARWPGRGRVTVRLGPPVYATDEESYEAFARRLETTVRGLPFED